MSALSYGFSLDQNNFVTRNIGKILVLAGTTESWKDPWK